MMTFHKYLLKLEAGELPPPPGGDAGGAPPGGGAPPPPGGDAMGGGGMGGPPPPGGDAMGGGAGGAPQGTRKAINVTTVWDAIKEVLGKDAHREINAGKKSSPPRDDGNSDKKKPKSLIQ